MGILALIAEFENDIRRERQMDGIAKAKERGTRFGGREPELTPERIAEIKSLRADGTTVPEIIRRVGLSKATVYRALGNQRSNLLADRVVLQLTATGSGRAEPPSRLSACPQLLPSPKLGTALCCYRKGLANWVVPANALLAIACGHRPRRQGQSFQFIVGLRTSLPKQSSNA